MVLKAQSVRFSTIGWYGSVFQTMLTLNLCFRMSHVILGTNNNNKYSFFVNFFLFALLHTVPFRKFWTWQKPFVVAVLEKKLCPNLFKTHSKLDEWLFRGKSDGNKKKKSNKLSWNWIQPKTCFFFLFLMYHPSIDLPFLFLDCPGVEQARCLQRFAVRQDAAARPDGFRVPEREFRKLEGQAQRGRTTSGH